MVMRVDDLIGTVTIGGEDVTDIVETIDITNGFTRRFSQATLTFVDVPPRWNAWDEVIISCGLYSRAGDMAGNVQRFFGYALDPSVTHWPFQTSLLAQGPLSICDRTVVSTDPYADNLVTPMVNPKWWDINLQTGYVDGVDLLQGITAGQTDSQMIYYVLALCGVSTQVVDVADIQGLATLLGSGAFDQFVWRVGQSALQVIEALDKIFSFRTFERTGGTIVRQRIDPMAPFTPVFTFEEGGHILAGAKITREIQNIKNYCLVTGYDFGGGPEAYVAKQGVAVLPPNAQFMADSFSSGMIELSYIGQKDKKGRPLAGLSCQETAQDRLGRLSVPMLRVTLPTHFDCVVSPGDVGYVNAPRLLGVNQALYITDLQIKVTPNSFTQNLTLFGQDYTSTGNTPTPSVGATVLPVGL